MTTSREHRFLEFERDPPLIKPYANLYRFGEGEGPAPLVLYIGGAAPKAKYQERRRTEPVDIVEDFEQALSTIVMKRVNLMVCPCPVETEDEGEDWFVQHFDDELVKALGTPPDSIALVGFSAGAGFATYFALVVEATRVLVTLGGAGLHKVAEGNRRLLDAMAKEGREPPSIRVYYNVDDQLLMPFERRKLPSPLQVERMPYREGEHSYSSYSNNGSAVEAFEYALRALGGRKVSGEAMRRGQPATVNRW